MSTSMTTLPTRLLVVDDDTDIVKLVSHAMRARGFLVEGASSLPEALKLVEATTYDVVLTDKNLKGATGLELIDVLTMKSPATAIVLMTAYPEGALGRISMLDGYVGKPFRSLDVMAQTLADAREGRQRRLERQKLLGKLGEVATALAPAPTRSR